MATGELGEQVAVAVQGPRGRGAAELGLDRHGPEILRPRERRPPRMANATGRWARGRTPEEVLGWAKLWQKR
jgi:hypothetical protein